MRSRPRAAALAAALGVTLLPALSCARAGNPRGGVPDRRPPVVISTSPAPRALIVNPEAEIRFQFNERISERSARGTLDDAVLVSPATGAVHVHHGSDWLGVRIDGGLQPRMVYRVTLLPTISDLFNNTMRDPFELVFTTGGRLYDDAVAGQAVDRLTGRPMADLTVELLPPAPQPDTLVYVTHTNDQGLYFFRYQPPGQYDLVAFQDVNRDRVLQAKREAWGHRGVSLVDDNRPDTLLTDVTVLQPDSTAAQLQRADVMDSVTLRLTYSDFLDPEFVREARVSITAPEGQVAPAVTAVLNQADYDARKDTAKARAARNAPGGLVTAPGQERGGMPRGVPLPRQDLIVQLSGALELNVEYRVSTSAIVNINRIPTGKGDTTVVRKPPPPPRTRADSVRAGLLGPAGAAAPAGAPVGAPAGVPGAARPDTTVRPGQPAAPTAPPARPDTTIRRDTADVVALRARRRHTPR